MTYELAKQLKDAGFPQGGGGKWIGSPQKIVWRHDDRAYYPTLEELIEACGGDFCSLGRRDAEWSAMPYGGDNGRAPHGKFFVLGKTPTEAVAHLWLALKTVS